MLKNAKAPPTFAKNELRFDARNFDICSRPSVSLRGLFDHSLRLFSSFVPVRLSSFNTSASLPLLTIRVISQTDASYSCNPAGVRNVTKVSDFFPRV